MKAAPALLRVAWFAVILGLLMEIVLVTLAAGFGTLRGTKPIVADLVQKVSWSVIVCVGLVLGAMTKKARGPAMGLSGLVVAPLAFLTATAMHKGAMHALSLAPSAGAGVSLVLIAAIKGVEYGSLGMILHWVAKKPWGGVKAYLATGLAVGIVFGSMIIALTINAAPKFPALSSFMPRAANEFLFPMGCAFAIYISHVMKRLGWKSEGVVT
jgi:hypothetical protein